MDTDNHSANIDRFLSTSLDSFTRSPLAGDASFRRYERITATGNKTYILMDAPPDREDIAPFIYMSEFLTSNNLSAPKVILSDKNNGFLLLEDLGDLSFNKALNHGYDELEFYKSAVDVLIKLHSLTPPTNLKPHSHRALEEVYRVIEWYIPNILQENLPDNIVSEFKAIWQNLLNTTKNQNVVCLYDYHADNLMWLEERGGIERVGLLDFQDAVIGSPALDLVALLQDIRRDVSPTVANEMLYYFIDKTGAEKELFLKQYHIWGSHWNTRILGTFARLAYRDDKPQYLDYLPTIWHRIDENLCHPSLKNLQQWFETNIPRNKRNAA